MATVWNEDGEELEVLQGGTIVLPRGAKKASISIFDLKYTLEFLVTDDEEMGIDAAQPSPKELHITFKNFNNPLGTAYSSEVGSMEDGKLILSLVIHAVGGAKTLKLAPPTTVSYNFLKGKANG